MINNIPSILIEEDVDRFHNKYQISRKIFCIFALSPSVCIEDQIPAGDTIIVYKDQLKAGLRFSMDPLFAEVLRFHKLLVAQLHPYSWRILVAFLFSFLVTILSQVLCYSPSCTSSVPKRIKSSSTSVGERVRLSSIGSPHI